MELDLRPHLERLDALLLRSAGVDPAALSFEFRPLWQMDAAASLAADQSLATGATANPFDCFSIAGRLAPVGTAQPYAEAL